MSVGSKRCRNVPIYFLNWKIWNETSNLQFSFQSFCNNHIFAAQKEQLVFCSALLILQPFLDAALYLPTLSYFGRLHSCLLPPEQTVPLAIVIGSFPPPPQLQFCCVGITTSQ